MTSRLNYLDDIRGTCLMFMALSHIFGVSGAGMNPFWKWFNPFFVGVFFIISGYLCAYSGEIARTGFFTYTKKKARALLIPYLVYSVLAAFAYVLMLVRSAGAFQILKNGGTVRDFISFSIHEAVGRENAIMLSRCIFTGNGLGTLWYLPAAFFAFLFLYFTGHSHIPEKLSKALLLISAIFLTYRYQSVIWYVFTPVLGMESNVFYDFIAVLARGTVGAGLMVAGSLIYETCGKKECENYVHLITVVAGFIISVIISGFYGLDFRGMDFGRNGIWLFAVSVTAFLMLRSFFILLERLVPQLKLRILRFFGRNSIPFMATHMEWYLVHMIWGLTAGAWMNTKPYGLRVVFTFILLLLSEYVIISAVNLIKQRRVKSF